VITITRKLEFDAGHRLMGHESKCRNTHGHRYVCEVTATAPGLDGVGRVIDFSVLKAELGGWLDEHWDHGFIFQAGDPIEPFLRENNQRCYQVPWPPTAEHMASFLLKWFGEMMAHHNITITAVRLWETPNCYALATLEG